jgi:hypothetical protein
MAMEGKVLGMNLPSMSYELLSKSSLLDLTIGRLMNVYG